MFRDTCRSIRDKLPLHVGRDLDPKLEKQVDAHLASCLSCFREYRALAETRAVLGVVAEERLPVGILDGFTEEVMARIAVGEEGPAAELPSSARRAPLRLVPVLSAAAALLMVALAAQLYFEGGRTVENPNFDNLLQQHAPESSASTGSPAPSRSTPAPRRFVFPSPAPSLLLQPEPGDDVHVPTEADRQLSEFLQRNGVNAWVELGGGLETSGGLKPRTRDR